MTFESLYDWGITREWAEALSIKERVAKNRQDSMEDDNHFKNLHFMRVIKHLTEIHALVLRENFAMAEIYMDDVSSEMNELDDDLEEKLVSVKVFTHVAHVTIQKCFEKMGLHEKAKEFENKVIPFDVMTDIEKSTLYGIRSYCLKHYEQGIPIAYDFAKKALNLNPDCCYWNMVFALCIRDGRFYSGNRNPTFLEEKHFEIAYRQNPTAYYGLRLAVCYKESRNTEKALKIFFEVKQLPIKITYIWLRLALGFIYFNELEAAKECLDEVEKINDSLSGLHFYKGLYYLKGYKNYDEAMIHLKKASDQGNSKAFGDYVYCIYRKNPDDRKVLELLEGSIPEQKHRQLNRRLNIALYYGINLHDYETALIKFSDILKENPQDGHLTNFYYSYTDKMNSINIFRYIESELLPRSRSVLDPKNREAWEAHDYLRNLTMTKKCYRKNYSTNWRTD